MMYQSLPYYEVWIKRSFLMGRKNFKFGPDEMINGVIVGVKAVRGAPMLFEVYLPEYHACYDKTLQCAIFNKKEQNYTEEIKLEDVGWWDCISNNIEVYYKALLSSAHVSCKMKTDRVMSGNYLYTIDFKPDNPNGGADFSQSHWWSEHKQKNFFFDNKTGVLCCGPNNKMRYIDESLCSEVPKKPFFKVYTQNNLTHETHRKFFGNTDNFDYEINKEEK